MGISAGGCEPDDPHDHHSIFTPPPLLRSTPSLPKVPSSSGRMNKSRSRNRLRRAPSSAINLFEADLSQRLTRISSGAALADAPGTTVPECGAAASITDRLAVNWRPRASFSLEEEEQEKDDGLAFRIDRSYSWGGQERQIQREEKEKRKLSEVILDQSVHKYVFRYLVNRVLKIRYGRCSMNLGQQEDDTMLLWT